MPRRCASLENRRPAPDFSLNGVDGRTYTLADFKDAPILMVAFLSNHCPYSHAADSRLVPMADEMKSRGLAVVAINPNSPDAVDVGELGYSKYSDSFDEMKLYAKERDFPFPYLYDGQTQATAKAYGCLCTPHIFIFDRDRHLRVHGPPGRFAFCRSRQRQITRCPQRPRGDVGRQGGARRGYAADWLLDEMVGA